MSELKTAPSDTKKVFAKCGTCSQTFCYLLNREFGSEKGPEALALDPLAGGLMNGHQCGMLWGSSLAVGTEAFRRHDDRGEAVGAAIIATQHILRSFSERTNFINCRDVTGYDVSKKTGRFKFMVMVFFTGIMNTPCFNLAEKWAPEAIAAAKQGLSRGQADMTIGPAISCASETARTMGASDEEAVMVAGFAGGLGLSGNGCGALAAAIWMSCLAWCRKNPGRSGYKNPGGKKIIKAFAREAGPDFSCHKITGRRFDTVESHTDFVKKGGCAKIIGALAAAE